MFSRLTVIIGADQFAPRDSLSTLVPIRRLHSTRLLADNADRTAPFNSNVDRWCQHDSILRNCLRRCRSDGTIRLNRQRWHRSCRVIDHLSLDLGIVAAHALLLHSLPLHGAPASDQAAADRAATRTRSHPQQPIEQQPPVVAHARSTVRLPQFPFIVLLSMHTSCGSQAASCLPIKMHVCVPPFTGRHVVDPPCRVCVCVCSCPFVAVPKMLIFPENAPIFMTVAVPSGTTASPIMSSRKAKAPLILSLGPTQRF